MRKLACFIVFLIIGQLQSFAQCAMCNETARTSTSTNLEEADALNTGIVFLLATPYLVVGAVIGIIIYTNRKSKKKQESME